uniref:Uncharacterized protein n=1 Tax=Aegilops tauschii TaxID=37682 RepID=R7W965_AEGTA
MRDLEIERMRVLADVAISTSDDTQTPATSAAISTSADTHTSVAAAASGGLVADEPFGCETLSASEQKFLASLNLENAQQQAGNGNDLGQ